MSSESKSTLQEGETPTINISYDYRTIYNGHVLLPLAAAVTVPLRF